MGISASARDFRLPTLAELPRQCEGATGALNFRVAYTLSLAVVPAAPRALSRHQEPATHVMGATAVLHVLWRKLIGSNQRRASARSSGLGEDKNLR